MPENTPPLNPPGEDLTYIKYSAKEILFHLTQKMETLQADVNNIKIDMAALKLNMVSRDELTATRRWAFGAVIAAAGAAVGVLRFLGV